jgi:hypothetical protein
MTPPGPTKEVAMNSTLVYQLALFFHVLAAFGLIAAMTLEAVSLRGLRQAVTGDAARSSLRGMEFVPPLGAGSAVLILVTGIYMMARAWGVQGWIVVALAGLIVNALAGALITRGRMARIGPSMAQLNGPLSPQAQRTLRDPILLASLRLRLSVVFGILFLMTVKPSLLVSLVVVLAAAAIGLITTLIPRRRHIRELVSQNG